MDNIPFDNGDERAITWVGHLMNHLEEQNLIPVSDRPQECCFVAMRKGLPQQFSVQGSSRGRCRL